MSGIMNLWISTEDAAKTMDITPRAVVKGKRMWETRIVSGATGKSMEVRLASLPHDAVVRYQIENLPEIPEVKVIEEDTDAYANVYAKANSRAKRHADKWSQILSRCEGVSGRMELEAWAQSWSRSNPEMAVSAQSIYRTRAQITEFGRLSLLAPTRIVSSTVSDSMWEAFKWAYLRPSAPSVPVAREIALGKCMDDGLVTDRESFPSVHAFQRRVNRELDEALLAYARKGRKRYNDAHGVHIERVYTMPAGSVWVGDTRTWDVFVKINGQEAPQTCYITLFVDMRTSMPMGWHLHTSAPSTDNTLRAIRNGIEKYGLPDELYLDNGREYRNKDFSGQTRGHRICEDTQRAESLAVRLNIKIHFAIVQRAQSKIIERNFLTIKGYFDKAFSSYKGGNVLEKPEILKKVLKSGKYIAWEDFQILANQFMAETFSAIKCQGKNHHGLSRSALWNELIVQRPEMRRVTQETASMLTTRTAAGKIRRQGFYLRELQCWYWAEFMPVNQGRDVVLRYDPEDLRIAWVHGADGVLMGEAMLWQAVEALVSHGDAVGKTQLAENIARTKRAEKMVREMVPDATKDQAREILHATNTALGIPNILNPCTGATQLTRHDHDAKTLATEAKIGKIDLSQFVKPEDNKPILIVWPDELPLAKQA